MIGFGFFFRRGIPVSGHVDWVRLFQAIQAARYDRWLVIESFGFSIPEIAAAACIWRDLADNAEDIASEGVRFLRGLTHESASVVTAPQEK
jgi:D-psicose/D-tagatose/L-ribulose 3-epimerase